MYKKKFKIILISRWSALTQPKKILSVSSGWEFQLKCLLPSPIFSIILLYYKYIFLKNELNSDRYD